tara:strand:+ start:93 stop:587 length:495 start_codon:yes stop_codon:yes gene_type:complete
MQAKVFILDVDGVMTTGQFLYTKDGKEMKIFGPDDNDGLCLLKPYIEIRFVTADKKGLPISNRRIKEDMNFQLDLVGTFKRADWIKKHYNPNEVIYMGDGIFDHHVMKDVGYSIAPANADKMAKTHANFITERSGGDRAVAEACIHILEKFFTAYQPDRLPHSN